MTLDLPYEVAAALTELASTSGLSVEEYLRRIVEQRLAERPLVETDAQDVSGMVLEDGLLIYGAATALPDAVVDSALHRSREERSQHLAGDLS